CIPRRTGMTKSQGLQVLAVDDEVPAVEQMRWLLEADPLVAELHTALNVAEAKAVLAEHNIDVVILDIHMPGPTGMDLAHELRRSHETLYLNVIFVTANELPAVHAFDIS